MKLSQGSGCNLSGGPEPFPATDRSTATGGIAESSCRLGVRDDCAELLHGLNNALVSMLLNAQVIELRLPSYSRLKRNLHEIERNAQRGGELVKRLMQLVGAAKPGNLDTEPAGGEMPMSIAEVLSIADDEPNRNDQEQGFPTDAAQRAVTARVPYRKKVPHMHV